MNDQLKDEVFPYDFDALLQHFRRVAATSFGMPQMQNVTDNNDLLEKLWIAASSHSNTDAARSAGTFLQIVYLTVLKEQTGRISHKFQEFITVQEKAAQDAEKQTRQLLGENQRIRRYTLGLAIGTGVLAIATFWMAWSTQTLANEAAYNMRKDEQAKTQFVDRNAMVETLRPIQERLSRLESQVAASSGKSTAAKAIKH